MAAPVGDKQGGAGICDDVVGDGVQFVDSHDEIHLGEQPVHEPEYLIREAATPFDLDGRN